MRKVFLDDLPRKEFYKDGRIDWELSVGNVVNFIFDDIKSSLTIVGYKKSKIDVEYNGEIYNISVTNFKKPALGNILGVKTDNFKINVGYTIKDDDRDFVIIERKYVNKKYTDGCIRKKKYYRYRCNKCGEYDWKDENKILTKKSKCNKCYSKQEIIIGVNDIPTTAPWMIKYFQGGYDEAKLYTKGSNKKIKFKCPDCGKIKNKQLEINMVHRRKSIGCACSDGCSYGEKFVYNLLEQLCLNFKTEFRFEWCKYAKYKEADKISTGFYDFVLEEYKLIIEIDGSFHVANNYMNGQTKEESVYIDNAKDLLAVNNGYKIVRIKCILSDFNEIKQNILKSELANIVDLSKVDWQLCEEFALNSNKVKEVCSYWSSKEDWETTKDLANKFKVNRNTITSYLKKGNNVGWTNYNGKEELSKAGVKSALGNGRKISISKNGKLLGEYNSIAKLSEISQSVFGIELNKSAIGKVARGLQKHHKGYIFKYVD